MTPDTRCSRTAEARHMPGLIVVGQDPRRRGAYRSHRAQVVVDLRPQAGSVPASLEEAEVEGRVELVGPDVAREAFSGRHEHLADERPVAVPVCDGTPPPIDVMHAFLIPVRAGVDERLRRRALQVGKGRGPSRGHGRRRSGSRRRRARTRTGGSSRTRRRPPRSTSRDPVARARTGGGTTGRDGRRAP